MEGLVKIIRYDASVQEVWNDFVESSKNGTFLFNRAYMDYHSDRFTDCSLLIFRKDKLYCLLPANLRDDTLYSHQGLTYGGLIMNERCTAEGILEVFDALSQWVKGQGIKRLVYKPVPYIYCSLPSEEDLYALFRHHAVLTVRNISSTIDLKYGLRLKKDRREAVRRAQRAGLKVSLSEDFDSFWKILQDNLESTYGAAPVHSVEEMKTLVRAFPENIRLYAAYREEEMVGGVVCYINRATVHAQYISATKEGKKSGAVDLIIDHIMDDWKDKARYLDLGTSNEDAGRYLNESLIYQKEGFGGRAVCYDTYEMECR